MSSDLSHLKIHLYLQILYKTGREYSHTYFMIVYSVIPENETGTYFDKFIASADTNSGNPPTEPLQPRLSLV